MKKLFLSFLRIYQLIPSFIFKRLFGGGCRFYPTCSDYAREAIKKHGTMVGLGLSLKRIAKCHPYGTFGFDPVPNRLN